MYNNSVTEEIVKNEILELLKNNVDLTNPSCIFMKYGIDKEERKKIMDDLSKRHDVLSVCGYYKYFDTTPNTFFKIVKIMTASLESDIIDVKKEYENNKVEYKKLGINSHQELIAVIEKYVFCTPTPVSTNLLSSEILKTHSDIMRMMSINQKIIEDVTPYQNETEFDEISNNPLDVLRNEYMSIKEVAAEYLLSFGKRVDPQKLSEILSQSDSVVRKNPDCYRVINITDDELSDILRIAAQKLKVKHTSGKIVFNSVMSECIAHDINTHYEFTELVHKKFYETITTIYGNINLELFIDKEPMKKNSIEAIKKVPDHIKNSLNDPIKVNNHTYCEQNGIRKKILDELSNKNPMSFSKIRNRLIYEFKSTEIRSALETMVHDNLLYSCDDNYRIREQYREEELNLLLSKYRNCVITSRKIYDKCKNELLKMDIRTPSELMVSLSSFPRIYALDYKFHLLSFDGMDIDVFVKDKYNEIACDENSFPYRLLNEYGIPLAITNEVMKPQGIKSSCFETNTDDKKGLLPFKSIFNKDFYTKNNFFKLLEKNRPDLNISKINADDLKILGYIQKCDCVYKDEYCGSYSAYKHMISDEKIIVLHDDELNNDTIQSVFKNETRALHWFCISESETEMSFVSIKTIEEMGINCDEINKYLNKIKNRYPDECFTLKRIRFDGIGDLDYLGFDDIFYEKILSKSFMISTREGTTIFSTKNNIKLGQIIMQIVDNYDSANIADIQDELEKKYGIIKERNSIMKSIASTNLYHPVDSDRVYKNKDALYEFARNE